MFRQVKNHLRKTTDDRRYEFSSIIRETRNHRNSMNRRKQQFSRFHNEDQSIIDFENFDR